jgi:CO dehydrogenase maturation factor
VAQVIAVAGKGGVGKTTLTGLLIQYLCETGKGPILAVDADANSNLNEVLGVEVEHTLGEIREEIAHAEMAAEKPIPPGMSKADYAEFKFNDALVEEDQFDLLVMGRTQGKGCYCFVNGLLQTQLAKLQNSYKYIVVDNEAGMEHISRGVLPNMDMAILVSDCSRRGVQAAGRIAELIKECEMHPSRVGLIVNRAPDGKLNEGTMEEIQKEGLDLVGVVPHDDTVYQYDCDGKPTVQLPADSPVRAALRGIVEKLGLA